jgi:hypothetical protein
MLFILLLTACQNDVNNKQKVSSCERYVMVEDSIDNSTMFIKAETIDYIVQKTEYWSVYDGESRKGLVTWSIKPNPYLISQLNCRN